jgi:uncharacterized protein
MIFVYLLLFFVVAAIYSSQGLGGVPTLIALLVLLPFTAYETKILALVLSIVVILILLSTSGFATLTKVTDAALVLIAAVPFVFLGARMAVPNKVFFFLLGCAFLLSAIFILIELKPDGRKKIDKSGLLLGSAAIGFFTGITGMVGSVLLLPLLQKNQWKEKEEVVLFSSIFVLITGFLTLFATYKSGSPFNLKMIGMYSAAVLLGSIAGRRIEISYLNPAILRNVTSLFLMGFGIVLIYNNWDAVLKLISF